MAESASVTGSKLLIANPGTGKTTAISRRVAELLKSGVPPSDILCLTFTVKATEEMLRKITIQCAEQGIDENLVHDVEVSTFHSFALKYLSESGLQPKMAGSNLLRYSILKSAYRHRPFNYSNSYVAEHIVPEIENSIRYVKSFGAMPSDLDEERISEILTEYWKSQRLNQILTPQALSVYLQFFIKAFSEYELMKKGKFIDYTDILIDYLKLPGDQKKTYEYVLVDELQDVNDVQARIIEETGRVKFLVGDRKQAIFGFQGGSLSVFSRFVKDPAYAKEIMGENHRSTEEILNYSKEFFRSVEDSETYQDELSEFVSEGKHGEKVSVIVADSGISSAVNLITGKLKETASDVKKTALITRTNDQLVEASNLLDEQNVDYTSTAPPAVSKEARNDVIKFLAGIFQDDIESIVNALYTPFSGLALKEAFAVSSGLKHKKIAGSELPQLASSFYEIRERTRNLRELENLFSERIIPASIPLGRDYTLTVMSLRDSLNEFIQNSENPDFEDLSDFLTISEEQYEPLENPGNLVLSTVHKAKGLEFDHVIYVPSRRNQRASFIDAVTRAVIRSVKGIEVQSELSGEDDRVDFVAFTRAREKLTVIPDERQRARYALERFCDTNYSEGRGMTGKVPLQYDEAYSLFVAGKYEEAKRMLANDFSWIRDEIRNHFDALKHISFSSIEGIEYPMDYLLQNILKVPSTAFPLAFGSRVHEIAQNMFDGNEVIVDTPELRQIKENIDAILWTIQNTMSMERAYSEKRLYLEVSDVFSEFDKFRGLKIMAFLDAVFKSKRDDRYLIIDYKTDMTQRNGSKHRRQLLLYRALLSKYLKVPEDSIELAIAYVSLREPVNTGEIEYYIDERKPAMDAMETVRRKTARFLDFKENPDSFIDYLLRKQAMSPYNNTYSSIASSIVSYLNGTRKQVPGS